MNMTLRVTIHARLRMEQRGISEQAIIETLSFPDAVETNGGLFLAKKQYVRQGIAHLLLVFYYPLADGTRVIVTAIDTSKVAKYR